MANYVPTDPNVDSDWEAWQAYKERAQTAYLQTNQASSQNAAALAARYTMLQPGIITTLARAGVKPGDPIAETAAQSAAQVGAKKVKNKSWFHNAFNATVRGTTTALASWGQELTGVARTEAHNISKYGVAGSFTAPFTEPDAGGSAVMDQTYAGQIAKQHAAGQDINTGSGFFVSEQYKKNPDGTIQTDDQGNKIVDNTSVNAQQAQATRDAYTIDGHGATLGRALASGLAKVTPIEPDDHAYNFISGAVDAANAWFLDPSNVAGGEFAKAQKAKKLFQPLSGNKASVFSEANGGKALTDIEGKGVLGFKKLTPEQLAESTGAVKGDRKGVAADIADNWFQSRAGRAVTERIASLSSPTDIRNAFNKKIDIDIANEMADAHTPEAVQDIIRQNVVGGKIREKPYTTGLTPWNPGGVSYNLKRSLENVRIFQQMPGGDWQLNDPTQVVDQLDRTLKNANFGVDDARKWTDKLARATSAEQRRTVILAAHEDIAKKAANTPIAGAVKKNALVRELSGTDYGRVESINKDLGTAQVKYVDRSGNPDMPIRKVSVPLDSLITSDEEMFGKTAQRLTRLYGDVSNKFRAYNIDDTGREVGVEGLNINGKGVPIPQPITFAQLSNESMPGLSRDALIDIRRATAKDPLLIRSLTGDNKITSPLLTHPAYGAFATGLKKVGNAWRDFQLLRGAYTLRVVGEEQLRMAANGLDSLVSAHPLSAIAYAIGGNNSKKILDHSDEELDAIREEMMQQKSNGISRRIAGLYYDPTMQKLRAKVAQGTSDAWGHDFNDDDPLMEGVNQFRNAMLKGHGENRWAKATMADGWVPVAKGAEGYAEALSGNARQLFRDPVQRRLAGGWAATDDVKRTGNDLNDVKEWYWNGEGRQYRMAQAERGGQWAQLAEDKTLADHHVDAMNNMVNRVVANDPEIKDLVATGTLNGKTATTANALKFFQKKADDGVGPNLVRGHPKSFTPEKKDGMRHAVDTLFDVLMTKPSNWASRSPAYRQYYWERQAELLPLVGKADQQKIIDAGKKANIDSRRLGALEQAIRHGSGDLTLKEADQLGHHFAVGETKKLLFDLSERGQFFDTLRIAAPFGEAWKEALTVWSRTFSQNPTAANHLGQTVDAAHDNGFFYTDENGNEVFNYPYSGQVSQMITGTFTPMKGQVSGLNLLGNGLPGLGVAVQIGADQLIKRKPNTPDWIQKLVLPVGGPDYSNGIIEAFFPGYAKRFIQGTKGQDNRTFGNTVGQMSRTLAGTGNYDLGTAEGQAQLDKDATKAARRMFFLRGAEQFFAPTAPSPEYMAKLTKNQPNGEHTTQFITQAKIMQDYRDMKNDPKIGYDNADTMFLQKYGQNALLYMQPLSEGSFDPTDELHSWVQKHPDVANDYKTVYGYFAGDGGDFSSPEYERQVATGERPTLPMDQVYQLAENRVARLQYNQLRTLIGPKPNKAQLAFMRDVQAALVQKYKGYRPDGYSSGDRAAQVADIERAVNDPRLRNNEAAQAAKQYMDMRKRALTKYPGLATAKQANGARQALFNYGSALSASNPEFTRMWTDLFASEVTPDTDKEQ